MIDDSPCPQNAFRNRGYLIEIVIGGVDHRQLHVALVFGIIFRVAAFESHVALNREEIGKQTACEHDNESGVSEMNSEFFPSPTKTFRVGRDEIHQQDRADEMAAWENWNFKTRTFRRPPNQQALEITLLRFMNSEMNLRQRACENERHSRREADDRQLQRRE